MLTITRKLFDLCQSKGVTMKAASLTLGENFVDRQINSKLKLYPNDGVVIKSASLGYNKNYSWFKEPFVDKGEYFELQSTDAGSNYTPYLEVESSAPTPIFNLNQNHIETFSNEQCELYLNSNLAKIGDPVFNGDKLEVKNNSSKKITSCQLKYSYGYDDVVNFTISSDGKSVVIESLDIDSASNPFFKLELVEPEPVFTVNETQLETVSNSGCSLKINGSIANVGDGVFDGDSLEVLANGEYLIESCVIKYGYSGSDLIPFTISEDKKMAKNGSLNVGEENIVRPFFEIESYEVIPQVVGFNNVYVLTSEQVRKLNQERFVTIVQNGEGVIVDYGSYIINLIEVPFSISEDAFLDVENVKLGDKIVDVSGQKISVDSIEIEVARIKVESKYNNSLDIEDTECKLFLPLAEPITLPANLCVGYEIYVELYFDLYDGSGVYYVYSSKTNEVINFTSIDFEVKIPLAKTVNVELNSINVTDNSASKKWFNFPFIQVKRNKVKDGQFFNSYYEDYGFLTKGYKVIDEIEIDFCDNNEESEILENILKQGIFIND